MVACAMHVMNAKYSSFLSCTTTGGLHLPVVVPLCPVSGAGLVRSRRMPLPPTRPSSAPAPRPRASIRWVPGTIAMSVFDDVCVCMHRQRMPSHVHASIHTCRTPSTTSIFSTRRGTVLHSRLMSECFGVPAVVNLAAIMWVTDRAERDSVQ